MFNFRALYSYSLKFDMDGRTDGQTGVALRALLSTLTRYRQERERKTDRVPGINKKKKKERKV